jgi:tRNA nucleotidyltransferase (CCA-adding enzyme)
MQNVRMYYVGGFVRDKILGVVSKDIDFAVVAPSYEAMKCEIVRRGGSIFIEHPEYFTIRAKLPQYNQVADFVLCRKDGEYVDGRRPEEVIHGTLEDDLARRDFTMNAIAIDENGTYIDPHNGIEDLNHGLIRCVGDTRTRFTEDHLRLLRAVRFAITKKMMWHYDIVECLHDADLVDNLKYVAVDRIRSELYKCFLCDSSLTIEILAELRYVREAVFSTELWLKPTTEQK